MIKKSDWEAAYRDLIAEGRQGLGEAPTEEEVLACLRGELSEQEAARVRELLVYYPELVKALEEPFPYPYKGRPGDADFLSEEELAQDWVSLQARVRAAEGEAATAAASAEPVLTPAVDGEGTRPRPWSGKQRPSRQAQPLGQKLRLWRLSAIAATLIAAVFGGLYFVARGNVEKLAQELREPRFNLEHRLLLPDGQRGSVTEQPPIPLPSEADYFLLIPALINQPQYPDYQLEIRDSSVTPSRLIWSGAGLRRRSDDTFEIWVPRSFLKPGRYQLVLYGLDQGRRDLLATYTVRLSPE